MKRKILPDLKDDRRPRGVLFSETGSSGWGRIRQLGNYKGDKKEGSFEHLHGKFWGEGDDPV